MNQWTQFNVPETSTTTKKHTYQSMKEEGDGSVSSKAESERLLSSQASSSCLPQKLSIEEAFNVLYEAYEGYLETSIPLRVKASPIEPSIQCFYVVDPKHFNHVGKSLESISNLSSQHVAEKSSTVELKRRRIGERTDEQCRAKAMDRSDVTMMAYPTSDSSCSTSSANQMTYRAKNLSDRVFKHLNLETEEALREQSNLRLARAQSSATPMTPSVSLSTGNGKLLPLSISHASTRGASSTSIASLSLISIKYQGFHGKNTEYWLSPKHDYKLGIVARAMAKVPRKTRAKETLMNNHGSTSMMSTSLKQRKHGFSGRQYTLFRRKDDDGLNITTQNVSRLIFKGVNLKDLIVIGVPSLVQFWPDSSAKSVGRKTSVMSQRAQHLPRRPTALSFQSNPEEPSSIKDGEISRCTQQKQPEKLEDAEQECQPHRDLEPWIFGYDSYPSSNLLLNDSAKTLKSTRSIRLTGSTKPANSFNALSVFEAYDPPVLQPHRHSLQFPNPSTDLFSEELAPGIFERMESTDTSQTAETFDGSETRSSVYPFIPSFPSFSSLDKFSETRPRFHQRTRMTERQMKRKKMSKRMKIDFEPQDYKVVVEGDLLVQANAVFQNLHVKGDLIVVSFSILMFLFADELF